MKVAAIATDFKLRRFLGGDCLRTFVTGCLFDTVNAFVPDFEIVAFFNLARKSVLISFGLFDNGIYVPCSKQMKIQKENLMSLFSLD